MWELAGEHIYSVVMSRRWIRGCSETKTLGRYTRNFYTEYIHRDASLKTKPKRCIICLQTISDVEWEDAQKQKHWGDIYAIFMLTISTRMIPWKQNRKGVLSVCNLSPTLNKRMLENKNTEAINTLFPCWLAPKECSNESKI